MAGNGVVDVVKKYRRLYVDSGRQERSRLLDTFCGLTGYHRKYATALMNAVEQEATGPRRRRGTSYSPKALRLIEAIWVAAGYPWSVRLVAILPKWLPWACQGVPGVTDAVKAEVLSISARQVDRRLAAKKRTLKHRIYGRTKPGTLLKHQIPIKTEHWDVAAPGHLEIDLVAHCGPSASGEFIYSLNVTDIHTGWCETRAIMGKCEGNVVTALDDIRRALPFTLASIDSDNGSEFINYHLVGYCKKHNIAFTRSRPYKKNDNAHIEQKNWTHVRRVLGWDRYDTQEQLAAINALYRGPLRLMMNLFQPCVKLLSKERVGSKVRRKYSAPQTPLQRLSATPAASYPAMLLLLENTQAKQDPFALATDIEKHLKSLAQPVSKTKKHAA